MYIDFLLNVFKENADSDAIIWRDKNYLYSWLSDRVAYWLEQLQLEKVTPGSTVMIEADFSPNAIALFLALIEKQMIIVPLTQSVAAKKDEFIETAMGQWLITINDEDNASFETLESNSNHEFYERLRANRVPGLVLFSSGSTGKSKAAVHDLAKLLDKFKVPRHGLRAITFLLYDHIGGVNTLLYTLSNGGCAIAVSDRQPDSVLKAVERHKAQLLPTSPTFINLILISEAYKRYDLSSLETVTYGTEPMPEFTLRRFNQLFPNIRLLQTYGLSELGIMRSKSKSSDSLWMKIGGEGFETRVRDNILEIKAHSAMLGYLNAKSPFTEDGWFHTGDLVEVDGEYMKVLGRQSEIINVGGQKVYPTEVESVLQELQEVAEAEVYSESNPLLGNIVCAKIRLNEAYSDMSPRELKTLIKSHAGASLESFKVPVKVKLHRDAQYSARFKKLRSH